MADVLIAQLASDEAADVLNTNITNPDIGEVIAAAAIGVGVNLSD